ncbi:MAG: radical SAM protein [Candidatus Bathyarchaeia archaeon]
MKAQTEFLDEEEFRILNYLRGRVADVEEVSRETKIGYIKCGKFLKHTLKLGIVTKSEKTPEVFPRNIDVNLEVFSRFPLPFLSAPSTVDVFITSKCNLKCVHCFSATIEQTDLSLNALESIFDQLEKMRVLEVRINGGEPLMHPQIYSILRMLEHRRFRKVILTNGTLLNDRIVKQLKKSNVTPTVSLDDSDAHDHDLFRGVEGAFEKTVAGLKTLQKNEVQYGINCCLHVKNIDRVEDIIKLAANEGACRITLLNLEPVGRVRSHKEWVPSLEKYESALPRLIALKAKYRNIDVSLDAFLSCSIPREAVLEAKRGYVSCRAGRTALSIFSDCCVYPCNSVVGDVKWNMGSLKDETLQDVWFSKRWAFFRGATRISDLEKCSSCKEKWGCRDFYCRLLPYVVTGDPFGPSLRCRDSGEDALRDIETRLLW